mmetsp:Transcript_51434/g.95166  ORF Transcript_51434/g.95166 Transcript_51434/m.95166 type:complete len:167 (-) Transcript_51434:58-558(-)
MAEQKSRGEPEADDAPEGGLQHPAVLRAALEIVKRKKAEAVQKEDYEVAHRFKQKMEMLERQMKAAGIEEEDLQTPPTRSASTAARRGAARDTPAPTPARRGFFSAPNPFRTLSLLEQSGYSRVQACGLLGLLYAAVFLLEIGLLYAGWTYWNLAPEGSEDYPDEF